MFNNIPFFFHSPPHGVSLTGLFGRIGLAVDRDPFRSAIAAIDSVPVYDLGFSAATVKIPYPIHSVHRLRKNPRHVLPALHLGAPILRASGDSGLAHTVLVSSQEARVYLTVKEARMSPKERAAVATAARMPGNGHVHMYIHTTTNPSTLQGFQNTFSKISPKFTYRLIANCALCT